MWIISERGFINLTERQARKPLIGSGSAWPCPFEYKGMDRDSLLLATDRLLRYTGPERIIAICRNDDGSQVPRRLIELVRYTSGALPDEVTVIFMSSDSQ